MGKLGHIFTLLTFLLVISVVLLICFGVTLVRPYSITSAFTETHCRTVNVADHGYEQCFCGSSRCSSVLPCKEIDVVFKLVVSGAKHQSRLFHSFPIDFQKEKCSFKPCDRSPEQNTKLVFEFLRDFGTNGRKSNYTCFYNPENPNEVVLKKTSRVTVIMIMFWPSLVIVVSTCGIVLHCRRKGCV